LPRFNLARAQRVPAASDQVTYEFVDDASDFRAVFWEMAEINGGWEFEVEGTGFQGRFRIEVDQVPEEGPPVPWRNGSS
jgi:hypothetical protein